MSVFGLKETLTMIIILCNIYLPQLSLLGRQTLCGGESNQAWRLTKLKYVHVIDVLSSAPL